MKRNPYATPIVAFVYAAVALGLGGCQASGSGARPPGSDLTSGRAYRRLLDGAKENPGTADWVAVRAAYAASPAYNPLPDPNAAALADAMRRNDWPTAARLADAAADANWMDLRVHIFAAVAYGRLGDQAKHNLHRDAALGILRAIQASGDGMSKATAYHVLAINEEYELLNTRQLHSRQQSLLQEAGHSYDRLSAIDGAGKSADVYFAIDELFPREGAIVSGAVKPVNAESLPR